MGQDYRNTSGLVPYEKGQSGNPGGKSKETVSLERSNAAKALKLRELGLDALLSLVETADEDTKTSAVIQALINPHALKMLKDAEDRGLGAPVQAIISPDGTMTPQSVDKALVDGLIKKLTD